MLHKLVKQDKEVLKSGDNCVHYEPQLLVEIFVLSLKTRKNIPAELYAYAANESTLLFRLHYPYEKMRICWVFSPTHAVALESRADPLFHCNY